MKGMFVMTQVIKSPYNDEIRKAVWYSFKKSNVDKHGKNGAIGERGEQNAIKLLTEIMSPKSIVDHSEDALMQLLGVDLTVVGDKVRTIDVKSGKTGLYWNRDRSYWYITIKDEFFKPEKVNTHFMHLGPKGDVYVMYSKTDLINWMSSDENKKRLIKDDYGYRIRREDWPDFMHTNMR